MNTISSSSSEESVPCYYETDNVQDVRIIKYDFTSTKECDISPCYHEDTSETYIDEQDINSPPNIEREDEKFFENIKEYESSFILRNERIECWEDTLKLCNRIQYPFESKKIKYLERTLKCSDRTSNIHIFDMDTIDCAVLFKELNPLVLNLADDNYAGGYVEMGSGAQEESLFRRSNYTQSLLQSSYPIYEDEAVYSPSISILKTNEETKWELIPNDEVIKLDFIACPAIKYPTTIMVRGEERLSDTDVILLKNKIKLIIHTALDNGHDIIIFGAMGCGAWENPRKHVAEIFKDVLISEYNGVILNYCFAILSTKSDLDVMCSYDETIYSSFDIFSKVFFGGFEART
jgi:uncharacterized protein (TIGR02452 family)